MVSSRASEELELAPPAVPTSYPPVPTAATEPTTGLRLGWLVKDARWTLGISLVYALAVMLSTLALHPYFSQTWDAVTFVRAGQSILSPDWAGLYALTRIERTWPFAYPPLHAVVVALPVWLEGIAPTWWMVRLPPLLFDILTGALLYVIVAEKTGRRMLARFAMFVWLLNPVTWYDTAVQAHFEAEWLFFVVLAYWIADPTRAGRKRGAWIWASLSLGVAILFKQTAFLFTLPLWAALALREGDQPLRQRVLQTAASIVLVAAPLLVVSVPFLLYSDDYVYMILQYVSEVPLQTHSWLVALTPLVSADQLFFRLNSVLILVLSGVISLLAARRKMGLWEAGVLLALCFFLLSKKVMGYYYVMLFPFALVALAPLRRIDILTLMVVGASFISLAPYLAAWTEPSHWWVFALVGAAASVLWLFVLVWSWKSFAPKADSTPNPLSSKELGNAVQLGAFVCSALFVASAAAALAQPLVANPTSPIRAPLVPDELILSAITALGVFTLLCIFGWYLAKKAAGRLGGGGRLPARALVTPILFAPLAFVTFTLTKESTALVEMMLRAVGM